MHHHTRQHALIEVFQAVNITNGGDGCHCRRRACGLIGSVLCDQGNTRLDMLEKSCPVLLVQVESLREQVVITDERNE